jgi:putative acetyltransferase
MMLVAISALSARREMSVRVFAAEAPHELEQARDLIRAFNAWHRECHHQDLHLVDSYFDPDAFAAELAGLPGKYAHPRGRLLLATYDGNPAGCVALREVDATTCEMKRMFVYPDLHGRGVGRALGEAVIREARAIGYQTMLLDTSIRQLEAHSLYRALGFRDIAPYYELPQPLRDWLVFMHLQLNSETASHRL